ARGSAHLLLERLVVKDTQAAPLAGSCVRAPRTDVAAIAYLRVETDGLSELKAHGLPRGAAHPAAREVECEGGFCDLAFPCLPPRLADHRDCGEARRRRGRHIASVEVKFGDFPVTKVLEQDVEGRRLRLVCRADVARQDQIGVEIDRKMTLVSVEGTGLRLPTVPHLPIAHRNAAVLRHALPKTLAVSGGVRFQILLSDSGQCVQVVGERPFVGTFAEGDAYPVLCGLYLSKHLVERPLLCLRVAPIDIERA